MWHMHHFVKRVQHQAHLPHQEIDVILKHIVKLLQGFTVAVCRLLLLLPQQVHQQLVLEPLYEYPRLCLC